LSRTARYVCIHGHFYQPPRENPWIEAIEIQDSAAPFHDWNERVEAECYAPNAAARILDGDGRIRGLVNNYARISFNVGPTLLSWMEHHAPATYAAILEADRESVRRTGRGAAMAQVFGHAILPLCNDRDRRTQVAWGVADFRARFGRDPEGLWLPETGVDVASLETLVDFGIRFTVLAPHQAARVRRIGDPSWSEGAGDLDVRVPYRVRLPSGRSIVVFFYDGPLSRAVAFDRLLDDGATFAGRLLDRFDDRAEAQLVHIATDGETFGHHHRFGEMALAFALDRLAARDDVEVTHYAAFLADHPPEHEAEIVERTAWSCAHGLGRWSEDCGCATGAHPGWRQTWRGPLRVALDGFRDTIAPAWERAAQETFADPWAARDAYVEVVLDRSPASIDRFLAEHARTPLDAASRREALELLELQRMAMLSYTSCGWFFDDLSGIETVQILQYVARAAELARARLGFDPEPALLEGLSRAPSNVPATPDGASVYRRHALPGRVDAWRATVHAAVGAMFEADPSDDVSTCLRFATDDWRVSRTGRPRHASGRVTTTDARTGATDVRAVAAVHLGGTNLIAGVADADRPRLLDDVRDAIDRGDVPAIVRRMEATFPGATTDIGGLLRDRRRRVARRLIDDALRDAETALERLYRQHAPTLRMLAEQDVPLPGALRETASLALTAALRRLLAGEDPDPAEIRERVREARGTGLELLDPALAREAECSLLGAARRVRLQPRDPLPARRLLALLEALEPIPVDLHGVRVEVDRAGVEPGPPWDALYDALGFAPRRRPATDGSRTGNR
jgi:alpha-amylase/alpha-mannosidase (GH57 family)